MTAPLRAWGEVADNRDEGGGSRRLALRVPAWPGFAPGQFVMLSPGARGGARRDDPLLPRPMAVYRQAGPPDVPAIEILYRVVGRGTALLADARAGQRLEVVGPLGRSFPLPEPGAPALLVGGGTGIASLYELAVRAAERGPVTVLLGARREAELMGRADFEALGTRLRVSTEDGSAGHRGRVTELLAAALEADGAGVVYACGPTPMMRAAAERAAAAGAPTWVSLENPMACGFGVCLGCAAPLRAGGFGLVCRDGPVLAADAVDWEGLAA